MDHPQLDLFGEPAPRDPAPGDSAPREAPAQATPRHLARILAHSSDRPAWLRARARGVTATDVAKLSTQQSFELAVREKLFGSRFSGNSFTQHGREREPVIASWVADHFSIASSDALFFSERDDRHLATPDGITADGGTLCEIKTSRKPLTSVPRPYLRQIYWQQYVLGAERTLFVWEQHSDFVPIGAPVTRWIERDEREIDELIARANRLLDMLAERATQTHRDDRRPMGLA